MSIEHRTPRAYLQSSAPGDDAAEAPPVSLALVEWLEQQFPVRLSPCDYPNNILADQATQRGHQEVIDYLRNLTHQQER